MRLERPIFLAPVGIGGFKYVDTALFPEPTPTNVWMPAADAEVLVEQVAKRLEGSMMVGCLLAGPDWRTESHFVTKIWVDQDIMAEIEVLQGTNTGDVLAKHIRQGGEVELWPRIGATPTFDGEKMDFVAGTCELVTIDCWLRGDPPEVFFKSADLLVVRREETE